VKLIIPAEMEEQIADVVYDKVFKSFVETGVTIFGEKTGDDFKVLGISGPGPDATHELLHYSGNNDYSTMIFEDLKKGNPNIQHIGELHIHPFGMSCLSLGDLETIQEVLKEYDEFIAGVMLRSWRIQFYPVYFSKEKPNGEKMEAELEGVVRPGSRLWFRRKRRD
jgi:hypothetical protein